MKKGIFPTANQAQSQVFQSKKTVQPVVLPSQLAKMSGEHISYNKDQVKSLRENKLLYM
jgi:hypothetical protein